MTSRFPRGGGQCTCLVASEDGTVKVTPIPDGYALAVALAPDQPPGSGGPNLLRSVGGTYLGAEQVAQSVTPGNLTLVTGDGSGGVLTDSGAGWSVVYDGHNGYPVGYAEPAIEVSAAGVKALVLPDQSVSVHGQSGAMDLLDASGMWAATLPRSGENPATLTSVSGSQVVVPVGQTRDAAVVLTLDIGQRSPEPGDVAFEAKTSAWYADWQVGLWFGGASVLFDSPLARWEPQPMSRNMLTVTLLGRVNLPAGTYGSQLVLTARLDDLPTSPNILAGLAGWSAQIIY